MSPWFRQIFGSDYDSHGNFRFVHTDPQIEKCMLRASTYTSDLNFGIMSFDNIGAAALILFISMPREGWYVHCFHLERFEISKMSMQCGHPHSLLLISQICHLLVVT